MRLGIFLLVVLQFFTVDYASAQDYSFDLMTKANVHSGKKNKTTISHVLSNSADNSYYVLLEELDKETYQLFMVDRQLKMFTYKNVSVKELMASSPDIQIKSSSFLPTQARIKNNYSITSKGVFDTIIASQTYRALSIADSTRRKSFCYTYVVDAGYSELPVLSDEMFDNNPLLINQFPKGRIISSSLRDKKNKMVRRIDVIGVTPIAIRITVIND